MSHNMKIIPEEEYQALKRAEDLLTFFEIAGIDQWERYDEVIEAYNEHILEQEDQAEMIHQSLMAFENQMSLFTSEDFAISEKREEPEEITPELNPEYMNIPYEDYEDFKY